MPRLRLPAAVLAWRSRLHSLHVALGGALMATALQVGDRVRWTSQSAGTRKLKEGLVIAVVLPGKDPLGIRNPGLPRNHVSYVIRAGGRLYWPRVVLLERVTEDRDSEMG